MFNIENRPMLKITSYKLYFSSNSFHRAILMNRPINNMRCERNGKKNDVDIHKNLDRERREKKKRCLEEVIKESL